MLDYVAKSFDSVAASAPANNRQLQEHLQAIHSSITLLVDLLDDHASVLPSEETARFEENARQRAVQLSEECARALKKLTDEMVGNDEILLSELQSLSASFRAMASTEKHFWGCFDAAAERNEDAQALELSSTRSQSLEYISSESAGDLTKNYLTGALSPLVEAEPPNLSMSEKQSLPLAKTQNEAQAVLSQPKAVKSQVKRDWESPKKSAAISKSESQQRIMKAIERIGSVWAIILDKRLAAMQEILHLVKQIERKLG